MASDFLVLSKLGGYVNSTRTIISSYPEIEISVSNDILDKILPIGSKLGDFIEDKHNKHTVLSYIFKITQNNERDDLFSFSVLLRKRDKTEVYKLVIKEFINQLEFNGLLKEDIVAECHQDIYSGFNLEQDIKIHHLDINFSKIFKDAKLKVLKEKPQLKGNFF